MGWLFSPSYQKKDLNRFIDNMLRSWESPDGSKFEVLRHCRRGNVVWAVGQSTYPNGRQERFILCNLIRYGGDDGWGYKDMDESMGPYYYSCPSVYLDIAPVVNQEWRDKVIAYANKGKGIYAGCKVILDNGWECTITNPKRMLAVYNGVEYKIPRKMIDKVNRF